MDTVSFDDWQKLDIRIGTILEVEPHPDADKLFILKIDEGAGEPRQLVAGLKGHYEPEDLKGKQIAFLANLEPRLLRGQLSKGMILAANDGEHPYAILTVDRKVNNNAKVS